MKTRLIVLIDFSPYTEALLQLAGTWCKLMKAELVLVHKVLGYAPALAENESRRQILQHEKEEVLSKLKALARQHVDLANTPLSYQVSAEGFLFFLPKILQQGRQQGFNDLLVLGLKGTGFLKQIIVGSTATTIIEELNHPTAAVPIKLNKLLPKKFILALTEKYPLNERAFNKMLDSFQPSVHQLEFISVGASTESEAYLKDLNERYNTQYKESSPEKNISASYKVFKGKEADVFKAIKNYVHQQADSILVVQKGPRSLGDKVFRKFLINELVHDGSLPLLIIPS